MHFLSTSFRGVLGPTRDDFLSIAIAAAMSAAMLTGEGLCFSDVTYPSSWRVVSQKQTNSQNSLLALPNFPKNTFPKRKPKNTVLNGEKIIKQVSGKLSPKKRKLQNTSFKLQTQLEIHHGPKNKQANIAKNSLV